MKKSVFLLFILAFCATLFSCGQTERRIFDYQENIRAVSGTYTSGDEELGVTLYFEKAQEGSRCRRIEYSSPESLAGISYTVEGDKITAELSGIRIAYSYFEKEKVLALSRLFCLSEEDIYDIKSTGDKTTTAFGKGDDTAWEVVTSKDGIPVRITYEDKYLAGAFEVKNIEIFGDTNGTK